MQTQDSGLMDRDVQGHWVRLETLTRLRWLAVSGQLAAVLVANLVLDLRLPLALCLSVIAVTAATNLLSWLVFPRSRRLSETEALLTLIFDTAQLSLLLFLTGGLSNPFALLLIAPVTIAATALRLRSTLIVGAAAIAMATVLALISEPLLLPDGSLLILPDILRFGLWLALVTGIAFNGLYSRSIAAEKHALTEALLAMRLALAREQQLTDIGGVVAATAHELGTPLATIKLASAELIDALDDPDLRDDAALIRQQAERCHEILRSMGRAGKNDLHMRQAPLESVVNEAAAPHAERGKSVIFDAVAPQTAGGMPEILRRPEVIHGLRNLIQNAVDFARSQVWVEADWTDRTITLRVIDDGPGYPAHLIDRIGEPYLRNRRADPRSDSPPRPEYEGMGLGLFIAKTLLERTGARVRFSNCNRGRPAGGYSGTRCGAMAEITWPRGRIQADARRALGENTPFVR